MRRPSAAGSTAKGGWSKPIRALPRSSAVPAEKKAVR
jgi:hypothetical protein